MRFFPFMTRDRWFYSRLLAIAVPVALQNLINFGVSMSDTVMVGMLGEVQLSAVALANQLSFIFIITTFGIAGGSNVMIAQFWGKSDIASIHKVQAVMYRLIIVVALIFTCIAFFFSRQVLSIYSTDPLVIEEGAKYLRIVGISYILFGLTSTTVVTLRSVGVVRISLAVYISSLCISVFLNWVLIFGNLGFPAMGVEGAATSTAIARVAELVIVLVYMLAIERKIHFKLRYLFLRKIGVLREFLKNAGPVVANELLWVLGATTVAAIIGRMGTEVVAANSINGVIFQLVCITLFGASNAAAAIIGNTIGEGQYEKAREYGNSLLFISICLGFIACGLIHVLKYPMLSLYNVSDTVYAYAVQIININSVLVILTSVPIMAIVGVLRGGGDTRFALLMDVLFLWAISIPLGFITGLWLGWPVPVVYIIIKSDELFKSIFCAIRILRGKWIHDVTR